MCLRQKVLPASIRKCSTIGPSASAGKNSRPPTIRITPTSRPTNSGPWVGKVPAEGGTLRLGGERAGDRHHRHDVAEAAEQHGDAERGVVPGRVGGEAGEGRAVVAGRRGVGVEDFAAGHAGRHWRGSSSADRQHRRDGGEAEDRRAAGSARASIASFISAPRSSCRDIPACARPSARRRTPR